MELHIRCQYGQRKRKDGPIVRGPCDNRASGFFRVFYHRGKPKVMALCADCGFVKMPNHVKIVIPADDAPSQEPRYFRDVARVELIATLGTGYDQTKDAKHEGVKHWVESSDKPKKLAPGKASLKRIAPRGAKMDLTAYRNSLRRHDDGK